MAKKLPSIKLQNFTQGINNSFDNGIIPDNQLRFAINMYSDSNKNYGALTSRNGIKTWINLNEAFNGLAGSVSASSVVKGLIAFDTNDFIIAIDNYTYLLSTTTGLDIGTVPFDWGSGTNKIRFLYYLGYIFGCNGTYIKSWDGAFLNNWGNTNLSSAPTGSLIEEFQGKVYVSGNTTNKSRVYFSKLPVAGALPAWDTTNDYFDVSPDDGDIIVSIKKMGTLLLIFKYNSLYVWDGTSLRYIDIGGAVNHESVSIFKNKAYYISSYGTKYTMLMFDGVSINNICKTSQDWFNSTLTNPPTLENVHKTANIQCSWTENENCFFMLSSKVIRKSKIGKGIVENNSFSNVILKHDLTTGAWDELSISNKSGSFGYNTPMFSSKIVSTISDKVYLVGNGSSTTTTDGQSLPLYLWGADCIEDKVRFRTGGTTSWNYVPIWFYIQTKELEFGSKAAVKTINKFSVFANSNYSFAELKVRVDRGGWKPLGGLTGEETVFEPAVSGKIFEFAITGSTSDLKGEAGDSSLYEPFVFEGFEFFDVDLEDYET